MFSTYFNSFFVLEIMIMMLSLFLINYEVFMKSGILFTITFSFMIVFMPMQAIAFADLDSVCLYIAEDDKKRLRKALKSNHVKIRNLFKEMSCNEMSLLQFAIKRNAQSVGLFMVKKIPVSALNKSNILQWIKDNGYQDSDISIAVNARISGQ